MKRSNSDTTNPAVNISTMLDPSSVECSRQSSPRSSFGDLQTTDCEADVESNLSAPSDEDGMYSSQTLFSLKQLACLDSKPPADDEGDDECDGQYSPVRTLALFACLLFITVILLGFFFLPTGDAPCCPPQSTHLTTKEYFQVKFPAREFCSGVKPVQNDKFIVFATKNLSNFDNYCSVEVVSKSTSKRKLINASISNDGTILASQLGMWLFVSTSGRSELYSNSFDHVKSTELCPRLLTISPVEDRNYDGIGDFVAVCVNNAGTYFTLVCGETFSQIATLQIPNDINVHEKTLMFHKARNSSYIFFFGQATSKQDVRGATAWMTNSRLCTIYVMNLPELVPPSSHTSWRWDESVSILAKNVNVETSVQLIDVTNDGILELVFVQDNFQVVILEGVTMDELDRVAISDHIKRFILYQQFGDMFLATIHQSDVSPPCESTSLTVLALNNRTEILQMFIPHLPDAVTNGSHSEHFWFWLSKFEERCFAIEDMDNLDFESGDKIQTSLRLGREGRLHKREYSPIYEAQRHGGVIVGYMANNGERPSKSDMLTPEHTLKPTVDIKTRNTLSSTESPDVHKAATAHVIDRESQLVEEFEQGEEFLNLASYITSLQSQLMKGIKAAVIFFQATSENKRSSIKEGSPSNYNDVLLARAVNEDQIAKHHGEDSAKGWVHDFAMRKRDNNQKPPIWQLHGMYGGKNRIMGPIVPLGHHSSDGAETKRRADKTHHANRRQFGDGFGIVRFFDTQPQKLRLQLFRKVADLPLPRADRSRRSLFVQDTLATSMNIGSQSCLPGLAEAKISGSKIRWNMHNINTGRGQSKNRNASDLSYQVDCSELELVHRWTDISAGSVTTIFEHKHQKTGRTVMTTLVHSKL